MKKLLALLSITVAASVFADHNRAHVDGQIGVLSPRAAAGQVTFNNNCAACHGVNGQGSRVGPPLIHDIYNPGHHDAASFSRAVLKGVQQHHWQFGNMPPQPQIGFSAVSNIMAFIREVQHTNGIQRQEHKM